MSAVDPNLSPVIVIPASGASGLPTTAADDLIDGAAANTFFTTNGAGNGQLTNAADSRALMDAMQDVFTTRGDLVRAGASGVAERFAAKTADTFVGGDGTDVTTRTAAQVRSSIAGAVTDVLDGAAWTETTLGGAATATWETGPARLLLTNPAAAMGNEAFASHATFIPDADQWDLYARFDVLVGTSANVWFSLRGGVDGNNAVHFDVRGTGGLDLYRTTSGTPVSIGTVGAGASNAPSTAQLAGGQFWARIARRPGSVAFSWGIGSGGAVPTSWTTALVNSDVATLNVCNGTYARLNTYAAAAVGGGFNVDVLDIRATGRGMGAL